MSKEREKNYIKCFKKWKIKRNKKKEKDQTK